MSGTPSNDLRRSRKPRAPRRFRLAGLIVGVMFFSFGCHRAPDDLREWKPSDHKHTSEADPNGERAPQVSGSAEPVMPGLEDVTVVTWKRACTNCHGQLGRGDGPQGPMVKARDLSDPAWQASVTDAQIATSITKGRGLMPPAPLPPATIDGLVHLVRLLNKDRLDQAAKSASGASGAPSGRGTPPPAPTQQRVAQ